MIVFDHVSKVYPNGTVGLDDVSLRIDDGEFVAIIGRSGAGKSTLLRAVNRMHQITSGTLTVNGTDVTGLSGKRLRQFRRGIGMVFQSFNLVTRTSVIKNVLAACVPDMPFWRVLLGAFRKEDKLKALESLDKVGILDKAYMRADQLSGGQQQRVALARILCSRPKAILLDEPFSALDGFLKWNLELELSDLLSRFDGPIVWVSHDLGECRRNCSQVCVMENGLAGRIMGLDELIRRPDSLSAARLAGYKNFFPCRACEGGVFVPDWGLTLRGISAGPEHSLLAVGPDAVDLSGKDYAFRVLRVIQDVGHNVVLLRPDGASENAPVLRIEAAPENVPQPGSILTLSLRPASLLLF